MSEDWRDKYFDDKFANIGDKFVNMAGNFKQMRSELRGYKQETTGRLNDLTDKVDDLTHKVDILSGDKQKKSPIDAKAISIAVGTAIGTAATIVYAAYEIYLKVTGS